MTKRIVAEISKTWPTDDESRIDSDGPGVIAQRFEVVIERNADRGYTLESWQFRSAATPDGQLVETIIAVFVKTHGHTNQFPPQHKDETR